MARKKEKESKEQRLGSTEVSALILCQLYNVELFVFRLLSPEYLSLFVGTVTIIREESYLEGLPRNNASSLSPLSLSLISHLFPSFLNQRDIFPRLTESNFKI